MLGRTHEEKYSDFLKNRVLKLLVPFILISAVYYIYDAWQSNTSVTLGDFLLKFSNNEIKYHFWFMYAIILIYLLIPFLAKMVSHLNKQELLNLILVLAGGNLINTVTYIASSWGVEALTAWSYPNLLCYINYLFLGYYLYHYGIARHWRKWIYFAGILSIVLMPVLDILTIKTVRTDALFVAGALGPLVASTALFTFFRSAPINWSEPWQKFFRLAAPLVFSIYMIHVLVMNIIKAKLLTFWTPAHFIEVCGFIVVEFGATLIVSFLIALLLTHLKRIRS